MNRDHPKRLPQALLHYAIWSAGGMFAGSVVSGALWLLVGGWGPPFLIPLVVIGLLLGLLLGYAARELARIKY